MLKKTLLSTLLLLSSSILQANAANKATFYSDKRVEERNLQLEEYLNQWASEEAPGVAVAISVNGKTVFNEGYGLANLEYKLPISGESKFSVASVSKQFTAFAILLLEDEGQLSLEDSVGKYLPQMKSLGDIIKIKHLLNHTSGLRETASLLKMSGWQEDDVTTSRQVMDVLSLQKGLNFSPGKAYQYNNSNYFLAARIVEKVSGQSFADFMKESVFTPLGMSDTGFYADRGKVMENRAYSYIRAGQNFKKGNLNTEHLGSTNLYTTAKDLLRWSNNFESPKVGTERVFKNMHERVIAKDGTKATFAKGHELRPYNGLNTWSHGGRDAGYRAFLQRVPEASFAVSVLSNRSDFDTAKVAFNIVDIYFKEHPLYSLTKQEKWEKAPEATLERFKGSYELLDGLIFEIIKKGEQLYFTQFGQAFEEPLKQIGRNEFLLNPYIDSSLKFSEDGDKLDYIIGKHVSLPAPKVVREPLIGNTTNDEQYKGTYYSEELNVIYKVSIEKGILTMYPPRLESFPLDQYERDVFLADGDRAAQKAHFIRSKEGKVIGFKLSAVYANRVHFKKVSL